MLNLSQFMPVAELATLRAIVKESPAMVETINKIKKQIAQTPPLYSQENKKNPKAFLHYFGGSYDAYITERGDDGLAFGWASFGEFWECGSIYIPELIENGIELDLYFTPTPIKKLIKQNKSRRI